MFARPLDLLDVNDRQRSLAGLKFEPELFPDGSNIEGRGSSSLN
jgi:hypothetical protein